MKNLTICNEYGRDTITDNLFDRFGIVYIIEDKLKGKYRGFYCYYPNLSKPEVGLVDVRNRVYVKEYIVIMIFSNGYNICLRNICF